MSIVFSSPGGGLNTTTWTPVLSGSSTAGTQTYTQQVGRYATVGNMAFGSFAISISALDGAAAGNGIITGFPLVAANFSSMSFPLYLANMAGITLTATYTQITARISGGASTINLLQSGPVANANAVIPITGFANASSITGSFMILLA